MTSTFTYRPEVKKQAKNPFAIMTEATHSRCHQQLRKRLIWLAQLGSSQDPQDQLFYRTLTQEADSIFGRSPEYNNGLNTGMAVLAGAVEKMYEGDLSMKQIKYITPVLELMAVHYPKLWEKIVFENTLESPEQASQFETLFDA